MSAAVQAKAADRLLLSGNEAIARGVWEAGVKVAAAYPGTPSTEILENIALYPDLYAEWSVNEKVSMEVAIGETNRRRAIQEAYNEKHGITPQTIRKKIYEIPEATKVAEKKAAYGAKMPAEELAELLKSLEQEMRLAAKDMDFERAAEIRDAMIELKGEENKYKRPTQGRARKREAAAPAGRKSGPRKRG